MEALDEDEPDRQCEEADDMHDTDGQTANHDIGDTFRTERQDIAAVLERGEAGTDCNCQHDEVVFFRF